MRLWRGLALASVVVGVVGIGCSGKSSNQNNLQDGGGNNGGADMAGGNQNPTTYGNPDGKCAGGVPAGGKLVDTSSPTTVVGTGDKASCTFAALKAAVATAGIITFDCGSDAVTIKVTETLNLKIDTDTVIDGGGKVTLDGGDKVQILRYDSPNFNHGEARVTLQRLVLQHGKTTPTEMIPEVQQPSKCSQGWNDGEGGALYMRDGNLTIIDCLFQNNQAAPLGPDTGGGGIYILGSKHGLLIVGSTFQDNQASNGAGFGALFAEVNVYNSLFTGNTATGHDANNNEPSKCSQMNNGQNETGSGGNGGALYSDGASRNVLLCGDKIVNNAAGTNAFGGGLFFTSNDFGGTLTIKDTTMTGNTGGHWTSTAEGTVKDAGTAVGTNAKSITIDNSTLQGL